jgi:hypothetical protein
VSAKSISGHYEKLRGRRLSMIELLATLVLMIVIAPFLRDLRIGSLIETVLLTLVLLAALVVIGAGRGMRVLAVVLAVPAVAGKWINHFRPDVVPVEFVLITGLLFVALVVVHLLRFTLRAPQVNVEVLCAAISNYLMLGLLWSFAYQLTARLITDSFVFSSGPASTRTIDGFNSLYFSFVTLSTIGYGDITPLSGVSRMLAIVEATMGMFYMTVLVARLVALYSSEKPRRDS